MKIFRPEPFGGVVYETETLRFELTTENKPADKILPRPKSFRRSDILSAPVRAYFELTRRCNLACRHCFVSSSPNADIGASTSQLKTAIDELAKNQVIDVRFTGGEVTTREDWFELLSHAKENELEISINTNGLYEDPDAIISQFKQLDVNQITVSIDGNQEHHDYMRGKGSYAKSIKAIQQMAKAGIPARTNTVLTKLNVADIPEILETVHAYVLEANFFHMRPVGRGLKNAKIGLDFEEHYHSAKNTLALRQTYPNMSIMHFEQSYRERSVRKSETQTLDDSFSHGNTTINVDCFGGVWPNGYNTYQDERLLLGNITQEPLSDIWNESETLEGMRNWYKAVFDRCQNCDEYLKRCPGLSPEMHIGELNQDISNQFCISPEPMPKLYGSFIR